MDEANFDDFTRTLSEAVSRRAVLGIATVGLTAPCFAIPVIAKKKRRRRKPHRNAFDCVDVGNACRGGKDALCCSGICEGKKPKKGKRDKSRCVSHDQGICQVGQNGCILSSPCGEGAECLRTTGKGTFCGLPGEGMCSDCKRDADCEADFGPGAACVICPSPCPDDPHTACVPPAG